MNNKIVATDLLRFEHLQEDYATLCEKYNIKPTDLCHLNKCSKNPTEYDDEIKTIVDDVFRKDFDLYNRLAQCHDVQKNE
mgnify:CR=1 FL=1